MRTETDPSDGSVRFRGPPDDVSALLHDLRLAHMSYCKSDLTRPWGLDLPYEEGIRFHYVVEGGCWTITATQSVWLEAGDVALMVNGAAHQLADQRDGPTMSVFDTERREVGPDMYRLRAGGGGERSTIVCCKVTFEEPFPSALVATMPHMLVVRAGEPAGQAIQGVLQLMASEVALDRPGSVAVMTRLADVAVTHLLRAWIDGDNAATAETTSALRDPQIGPALLAIHRDPGRAWSVEALAALVHVSRSTFAERFRSVMGVSPARYTALWRMRIAEQWLRQGRLNVAEIAVRLGYDSEASFARAFKRVTGRPPGRFRRDVATRSVLDERQRNSAERP